MTLGVYQPLREKVNQMSKHLEKDNKIDSRRNRESEYSKTILKINHFFNPIKKKKNLSPRWLPS